MNIPTLTYPTFKSKCSKILINNIDLNILDYLLDDIFKLLINRKHMLTYCSTYNDLNNLNISNCKQKITNRLVIFSNIRLYDKDILDDILDFSDNLVENTVLNFSESNHIIIINNDMIYDNKFLCKMLYRIDYLFTQQELDKQFIDLLNKYEFQIYSNDKVSKIKIFQ